MNKLSQLFENKKKNIISIYFTAGYPELNSTNTILEGLNNAPVDLIEIGFPYSDPIADGKTIQKSSAIALKNGIDIQTIFNQVQSAADKISKPIIAMGYYNQFLQFGEEAFLKACAASGISGVILPDLPLDFYQMHYKKLFKKYNIAFIFLITPQTSDERVKELSEASDGFLYMVSSSSITGKRYDVSEQQIAYFNRIKNLKLKIPYLIGFGIHDKKTFDIACTYSNGAIIGSAFIKAMDKNRLTQSIQEYIQETFGVK